jgi:ribosome maturation factor RimP
LKQCADITRNLRKALGEAYDDVEITVSSPGLDRPFKHPKQYQKNLNKSLEVTLKDGTKITGKLEEAGDEYLVIREYKPLKGKNKAQKPELSDKITTIAMNEIKQTNKMIIF